MSGQQAVATHLSPRLSGVFLSNIAAKLSGSPARRVIVSVVATFSFVAAYIGAASHLLAQEPASTKPLLKFEVRLISGEKIAPATLEIAAGQIKNVPLASGSRDLPLDELSRITISSLREPTKASGSVQVYLRNQGFLAAESVTISDDEFHLKTAFAESLDLTIDLVRGVVLKPKAADVVQKLIKTPSADNDRLIVAVDDKLETLEGLIVSVSATEVKFEIDGMEKSLPFDRLAGIVVAQARADDEPARLKLKLTSGELVAGESMEVSEGLAILTISGDAKLELPLASIKEIAHRSSQLEYLSDLTPSTVFEQPVVTLKRPYQVDRSISGKPLNIGGTIYEKGIGVHAISRLTYQIEPGFDQFVVDVGLDAAAAGKGNCIFVVLGDGQQLASETVQGKDAARTLRVPIRGVRELTIAVEAGEDLDLADHANWCEARLLKVKSP